MAKSNFDIFAPEIAEVTYQARLWSLKQGRDNYSTPQLFMGVVVWCKKCSTNERTTLYNKLSKIFTMHKIEESQLQATYERVYIEDKSVRDLKISNVIPTDDANDIMYSLESYSKLNSNTIIHVRDLIYALFTATKKNELYSLYMQALKEDIFNRTGISLDIDALYEDMSTEFKPIITSLALLEDSNFLESLTEKAINNPYPIIGVDDYVAKMIMASNVYGKDCLMLIGDAGIGKTAIVERFAKVLATGDIDDPRLNNILSSKKNSIVVEMNMSQFNAKVGFLGVMEQQINELLARLEKYDNVYVFIDEIHQATSEQKELNILDKLKPAISGGKIKLIGTTTEAEYNKFISKDGAIARRFHKIMIHEPSNETVFDILSKIKPVYEKKHNITISDDMLKSIILQPAVFGNNVKNPDRSKSFLGLACSYAETYDSTARELTLDHLFNAIEKLNDLKVPTMSIKEVSEYLNDKVLGQENAIKEICIKLAGIRAGASFDGKPKAVYLFAGSTGTGKTETARQLAKLQYGTEKAITIIDMVEYENEHDAAGITGSKPGFVGYGDGTKLVNALRHNPRQIILFDEIEKAHKKVCRVLQTLFDTGRLTDGAGNTIDASEAIIICTTNLGFEDSLGYTNEQKHTKEDVINAIKKFFPQDFRSRFTNVVLFNRLSDVVVDKLIKRNLDILNDKSKNASGKIHEFTEADIAEVKKMSRIEILGARDIANAVSTVWNMKEYKSEMERND